MKIKKSNIPPDSLVNNYSPCNYKDAFECEYTTDNVLSPDDIQVSFWTDMPTWINNLFKLRNIIVKPFGLDSNEKGNTEEFIRCIREGGATKLATVTNKSPRETVLCLEDKHLRAYLSVHIEPLGNNYYKARTITVVQFKYWLGYCYFYAICPFHHMVVKGQFKYTLKNLLKSKDSE